MTITERLKEILRIKQCNVSTLARQVNLYQSTVQNYFDGRTPSVPFLEALLRAFPDISAE